MLKVMDPIGSEIVVGAASLEEAFSCLPRRLEYLVAATELVIFEDEDEAGSSGPFTSWSCIDIPLLEIDLLYFFSRGVSFY